MRVGDDIVNGGRLIVPTSNALHLANIYTNKVSNSHQLVAQASTSVAVTVGDCTVLHDNQLTAECSDCHMNNTLQSDWLH